MTPTEYEGFEGATDLVDMGGIGDDLEDEDEDIPEILQSTQQIYKTTPEVMRIYFLVSFQQISRVFVRGHYVTGK